MSAEQGTRTAAQPVSVSGARKTAIILGFLGGVTMLLFHWMVFFWVPTEATMGIIQRIFYVHVPAAWAGEMAFGIAAFCSGVYLWLGDERLDVAAESAAEGGMAFFTVAIIAGPLWAKVAWGTYWTWEPRLTFSLLLWMIFLGYFLVRSSILNTERARRMAAVVAIVGAADIPLIHVSVNWLRSLHPEPVVLRQDGPQLDGQMLTTLMVGLLAFTLVFFSLFAVRYGVGLLERFPSSNKSDTKSGTAGSDPALESS